MRETAANKCPIPPPKLEYDEDKHNIDWRSILRKTGDEIYNID